MEGYVPGGRRAAVMAPGPGALGALVGVTAPPEAPEAPEALEGAKAAGLEAAAAAELLAFTGHHCQAYAPEGMPYEHKYTMREAALALGSARSREGADALYLALAGGAPGILWGELRPQDLDDAAITAQEGGNHHAEALIHRLQRK